MEKSEFSKKKQQITQTYQKIYNFIFSYGIFLLIMIIVGINAYNIFSNSTSKEEKENPLLTQRDAKIKLFLSEITKKSTQTALTGPIFLGQTEENDLHISSSNNLAFYKGFVIPRFFGIYKNAPLQNIDYFNKGTYSLEELDVLFKNIFVGSSNSNSQKQGNTRFPIQKSIIDDFNLKCISQTKINNFICNIFINEFLDNFFVYTIETDSENFTKTMQTIIQQQKFQDKACQQLVYYSYYNQKSSSLVEELLQKCPTKYQDQYRMFSDFNETQIELESKLISAKIYKDNIINIYKLISFQQIIYDDINNKIINPDRLQGYFNFLQEILKKNKIELFYKELTYFFNNYYLKKTIENIETANKAELDTITKQIISINNGNTLIGYRGLQEQIQNKTLIKKEISIQKNLSGVNYDQKIESLLSQIKSIEIKQKFLSGNNILIYGIWEIENKSTDYKQESKIITVSTKLRLEEDNNTLILKQIMLEKHEEIAKTINKLLETKKRTFADLQQYTQQNSFLFTTNQTTNNEEVQEICKTLSETLENQEIKICNNNKIDIDMLRNNKIITMTINHDNFLLQKIDISDEEAKTQLHNYLQKPDIANQINYKKINKSDFISFLQKTITEFLTFKVQTEEKFEGSSNTMIIMERIKKYLGIQVNDIVEKNNKILIDFTIANISFLGYYNLQEHKIAPLYFKEANTNKTPVMIKNTSIILSDEEKTTLNIFLLQPLEIIKKNSPEEYLLYQKYLSEKNKTF